MNRIKQLRQQKGLSIDELSKKLKEKGVSISPASISKYEREVRKPKIDKWIELAKFFGVSISYLQGVDDSFSKDEVRVHDMTSGLYYDLSRSLLNDVPKEVANRMIKQESKIPNESLETFAAMNLMFYSMFLEASTGENDYSAKYLDIIIQALNEYGNRDSKTN